MPIRLTKTLHAALLLYRFDAVTQTADLDEI